MTHRLVIFDCDGTLVDSQHAISAAMAQSFKNAGIEPPERQRVLAVVGLSLGESMEFLAPSASPAVREQLIEGYRHAFFEIPAAPDGAQPLYPGAYGTVTALAREPETLLGIATGKSRRGVDRVLKQSNLAHCFQTIQTADAAPSKPHPGMILNAMEETGASPQQTLMIGDTTFDMEMAVNAGIVAIGVAWGYHPERELKDAGADRIVHDFDELNDFFRTCELTAARP